jgi:molybdopterin/thiamine biosynthesis adenylyltransferase
MTTSRLVFRDGHLTQLRRLLFDQPGIEGAAFVLCGEAHTAGLQKLISHAVVPIADQDYLVREPLRLSIGSRALARITKLARYENLSILFAHSHPGGLCEFSEQDDGEEDSLIPFLQARLPGRLHGTVVLTESEIAGRIYGPDRRAVEAIYSIGTRIRLLRSILAASIPEFFDRQIRAFGKENQTLLRSLRVGVVGVGGTGSAVAEQLYRLGIGSLVLFDGDRLDKTNLNRVYGARLGDVGQHKVEIAKRHLDEIGLSTTVEAVSENITWEETARRLTERDVLFGCTDKQIPRAILLQLSLRYAIPVFDLGVLLESVHGHLRGVHGRVTTLLPGEACLLCRERISAEGMRLESLSDADRQSQIKDGYAPELDEPAPAVIPFTSAVASLAVSELLHRVTGFMGPERHSTELLVNFDQSKVRTNRVSSAENCLCSTESLFGRGDETPFLGMVWPTRTM